MPIPKIVVTLALMAVQAGLQMTQKVRGPRLDSLKTTTAEYGTPIPRFWGKRKFECPVIWAADLIETRHTSKGKAGKNTQYKYFADFAVLICDHEIDAVTRIWMDDKLVYQTTSAGPVSVGATAGLTVGGNMRVYLGTETQDADPLMEAWCEDKYGANSCPAYRGSSIVVFERLPVNNFGNRIPNITIEAVSVATGSYPFTTLDNTSPGWFSPDGLIAVTGTIGTSPEFFIWDVPTLTVISSGPTLANFRHLAVNNDGSFYTGSYAHAPSSPVSGGVALVSPSGSVTRLSDDAMDGVWQVSAGLFGCAGTASDDMFQLVGDTVIATGVGFQTSHYFDDADGASWAVGGPSDGSDGIGLRDIAAAMTHLVTTSSSGRTYALDNGNGQFFAWQDDNLYLIDKVTFSVTAGPVVTSYGGPGVTPGLLFATAQAGDPWIWIGFTRYSTQDLSVLQTEVASNWTGSGSANATYDRVNDAMWGRNIFESDTTVRFLNRIGSNGVTLRTVVDSVSEWVGLTGHDSSALTQPVLGYSVTQGTGKDMIGPLLDIHDVDARPHDFQVQFKNRGSAASGTILTEDFVRADNRYTITIKQDTDLPRKLTFNYADNDHEQQPNNAIAQRPFDAVDTSREETVDLSTYADTADGAQQKADRYLRRIWNSRESVKNSLTAQHLALEPADKKTLSLDGVLTNVRLDKLTYSQTGLECEWIRDEVSVASLNSATSGAPMDNSDEQTITIPAPVKGFILDAPLVQDADNDVNPVLYEAAGSYNTGTDTGATVNRGDDGTYDELFGSVSTTDLATWGYATSELATANPNLWDRGNTVDVQIYGTLTSATEAEIDADPTLNLIALGADDRWEYLNFSTATLTGTSGTANTYTLSGFKRGRRGTELNVANHEVGDQILVLSKAIPVEVGTDDIGDSMSFKIQSIGRDVDAATAIDLTYDGNTLKPYAPARVIWTTDGTDMFGEIIRRTRVGGAWVGGSAIPLSENSEAYEVDILDGSDVLRTIAVTGTNLFTYTGAEIAADGGTVAVPPSYNAYQMSDAVGRGFALAA